MVLHDIKVVAPAQSLYCHCEYSGTTYQIGQWSKKWRDRTKRLPRLVKGDPACYGEGFKVSKFKPKANGGSMVIHGGPKTSVLCLRIGFCYSCASPCKSCAGGNTLSCKSCKLDHLMGKTIRETTGLVPYKIAQCERPPPMKIESIEFKPKKGRLVIAFPKKILKMDFARRIKIVSLQYSKATRRLRNLSPLSGTRSLAEEKFEEDTKKKDPEIGDVDPAYGVLKKITEIPILKASLDGTGKQLSLYLDLSASISGKIRMLLNDTETMKSSEDQMMYVQSMDIDIERVEYLHAGSDEVIGGSMDILSRVLVMVMFIVLLLSPKYGIDIIKVFQSADYMLFFNVSAPTNLGAFLTLFGNTPFDFVPNPVAGDESTTTQGCTPGNKFEDNDVSCYIIANIGQLFLQALGITLVKIIALSLVR